MAESFLSSTTRQSRTALFASSGTLFIFSTIISEERFNINLPFISIGMEKGNFFFILISITLYFIYSFNAHAKYDLSRANYILQTREVNQTLTKIVSHVDLIKQSLREDNKKNIQNIMSEYIQEMETAVDKLNGSKNLSDREKETLGIRLKHLRSQIKQSIAYIEHSIKQNLSKIDSTLKTSDLKKSISDLKKFQTKIEMDWQPEMSRLEYYLPLSFGVFSLVVAIIFEWNSIPQYFQTILKTLKDNLL